MVLISICLDLVLNLPDCVLLFFLEKDEFHKLSQTDSEELASLVQSMLWYSNHTSSVMVILLWVTGRL